MHATAVSASAPVRMASIDFNDGRSLQVSYLGNVSDAEIESTLTENELRTFKRHMDGKTKGVGVTYATDVVRILNRMGL